MLYFSTTWKYKKDQGILNLKLAGHPAIDRFLRKYFYIIWKHC